MITTQTTAPAGALTEIQIEWGEDASCTVCRTDLPATAPAWIDGDGVLCCFCADAELTGRDNSDAEWIARAVRMAAAEIVAEEPAASPQGAR